jgi:hypothetical protein
LQSEDDEPAVKISSVIAVLSLTMQPYKYIYAQTMPNGLVVIISVEQQNRK